MTDTKISGEKDGVFEVRGEALSELVRSSSFAEAIFFLHAGRKPTAKEARLFEAMLVSSIDHGAGTPSTTAARTVASTGNPLNAAAAAGILAQGDKHGRAVDRAMEQYSAAMESGASGKEFVGQTLEAGAILYGFGHSVYKGEDPRTTQLLRLCDETGYTSKQLQFVAAAQEESLRLKRLCLNVDGCIAAALLGMGFSAPFGSAFFMIARMPGLLAHAHEASSGKLQRTPNSQVKYTP